MKTIKYYILIAFVLVAGCESNQQNRQNTQFEEVSEKIEEIRSQSEPQMQTQPETADTNEPDNIPVPVQESGNIKITVKMLTVKEQGFSQIDALWQYADDNFIIYRRPDIFNESGLKVEVSRGGLTAQLAAAIEKVKSSQQVEMFLVLQSGSTGYINMGKEIAIPQFYYLNRWYKGVEYQFKKAGRAFKVIAVKIPDRNLVNLRIIPVFSSFLNDGGDKEFIELMTNITVKPGESILIGGSRTSYENLATAILGRTAEKTKTDTVIVVDVSLL
ncbi:MAG: hypothetical protein JW804_07620 [Sedimentisphaerales bacterium]|nr:hypothetical protein [Sedimentisphaerales bacterium]